MTALNAPPLSTGTTEDSLSVHNEGRQNDRRRRRATPPKPHRTSIALASVLALQLLFMLPLRNSAFQDEAVYLYGGRQLLAAARGGANPELFSTYFSGLPYFYPVVAAAVEQTFGLEGARFISTLCMLFVTYASFRVGRALFDENVGLLSAAILVSVAPVLFIGRLATYDAVSLALLAGAGVIAVEAGRRSSWSGFVVIALCALAIAAKYAAAAFVPTIILAYVLAPHMTTTNALRGAATGLLSGSLVIAGIVSLLAADPGILVGLTNTTTDRFVTNETSWIDVLARSGRLAGAIFVLALLGLITLVLRRGPGRPLLLVILFSATAAIVPTYHAVQGELTSLDKHLAIAAFFLAPAAAVALHSVGDALGRRAFWFGPGAILVVLLTVAQIESERLARAWPNSASLITTLQQVVRVSDTRILAEEVEVPKYYLGDRVVYGWQFTGLDFIEFEGLDGTTVTGEEGYARAIEEGYFGVIAFRYGPSAELATRLSSVINDSNKYEVIAELPFDTSSGTGSYVVWRQVSADPSPVAD